MNEALDKVESLAKEPERMKDVEMVESSLLGAVAGQNTDKAKDQIKGKGGIHRGECCPFLEI